jgi:hypothetical protein
VLLLVVVGLLAKIGSDLDEALSDVLTAFPGFLKVLWPGGFWLPVGWAAVARPLSIVASLAIGMLAGTTMHGGARWRRSARRHRREGVRA